MRRSAYRRRAAATAPGRNRRLFAVGAVITAVGAALAGTQIAGAAENDAPEGSGAGKVVNGQVILTDTCVDSRLEAHDGFQKGDRCVSTEFGEVSSAGNNSSLLITEAPEQVNVNTPFQLEVSTRNLIRDRFLAAGQGGYYVESSVLQNGIVRGHFHTACRILPNLNEAPDPSPVPAFFVATEDRKGGKAPDTVTINVPGLPQEGTFQCASWAGDGSHRIPMQERANETPALDAVRITVRAGGGNQGGNNGGGNNGGNNGGGNGNGGNQGGGNNGGNGNGGNQGGGNGGNQGGNNGGQQGGGNNGGQQGGGVTTPPTGTPNKTTAPDTKSDFTPNPSKSTSTAKPKPTTTKTKSEESTRTSEETETDTSDADTEKVEPKATTKAAKPKASRSTEAATDFTYSNDDGQFNSGNKAPVADQVAQVKAESANKDEGLLASTGSNTIAMIGGAAVLLLIGLITMALTRRQRPGSSWQ